MHNGSVLARVPLAWRQTAMVAAFDWDATLTSAEMGHGRRWFNDAVVKRLSDLHASGYAICVFSNQARIGDSPWNARSRDVRARIDDLLERLSVPVAVFIACNRDGFRKPERGMWDLLFGGVQVDMARSFFVGDAAGRPGDHSDCDKVFADRIGVTFFTPELCFGDRKTVAASESSWRP